MNCPSRDILPNTPLISHNCSITVRPVSVPDVSMFLPTITLSLTRLTSSYGMPTKSRRLSLSSLTVCFDFILGYRPSYQSDTSISSHVILSYPVRILYPMLAAIFGFVIVNSPSGIAVSAPSARIVTCISSPDTALTPSLTCMLISDAVHAPNLSLPSSQSVSVNERLSPYILLLVISSMSVPGKLMLTIFRTVSRSYNFLCSSDILSILISPFPSTQ